MYNVVVKKFTFAISSPDEFLVFLPVVFHNLKCYDAHFVIKHFKKQYTERPNSNNNKNNNNNNNIDDNDSDKLPSCDDVIVTPINSEKYIMFQVGNLRFLNSFQVMSTSLENLVSLLLKSGREKFVNTTRHLRADDLVFAKGIYPYSYMTCAEKFQETELPLLSLIHI